MARPPPETGPRIPDRAVRAGGRAAARRSRPRRPREHATPVAGPRPCPYTGRMTGKPEGSHRVRWLWTWIAQERRRRGIGRAEFARRIGIGEETLRGMERGQDGSDATALMDALAELGADGAVAEIPGMNPHGAAVSLSKNETREYDAIAEDSGVSRAQIVRQLAAEGLVARVAADRVNAKSKLE